MASSVNVLRVMWNLRSPPVIKSTTIYLLVSVWLVVDRARVIQIFNILKTVSQIAKERVIQVLQHSSFAQHVPHTFASDDLILSDVL